MVQLSKLILVSTFVHVESYPKVQGLWNWIWIWISMFESWSPLFLKCSFFRKPILPPSRTNQVLALEKKLFIRTLPSSNFFRANVRFSCKKKRGQRIGLKKRWVFGFKSKKSMICHSNGWFYLFKLDHLGMDQYLLIPFLGGWTSIYQLFWCSPGVQGFDTLPFAVHLWSLCLILKPDPDVDKWMRLCSW